MPLDFGWKAIEVRESFWKGDSAFRNISAQALAAWEEDADGSHLAPYALDGVPAKIVFRNLNADENRLVSSIYVDAGNDAEAILRTTLLCFRIGVDIPDHPEKITTPDGAKHSRIIKEHGVRMLSLEYVSFLQSAYPGLIEFYGGHILKASFPRDAEKKASSPPSMQTPSLGAGTTSVSTDQPSARAVA